MQKSPSWYKQRVQILLKKPQPEQKSKEWFIQRQSVITASEAASCLTLSEEICKIYVESLNIKGFKYDNNKCLSSYDTLEDYIIKKCDAFNGVTVYKDTVFTLWGKKYEEIATRWYRRYYNTGIIEFGLLPHSRIKWLGASPDGITPDGIMLEIKCPYSRKLINGYIPIHYWIQIQVQLEVADLDFCDYLECEIKEISMDEFINNFSKDSGILINNVSKEDNEKGKYIYPPDALNSPEEYLNWGNEIKLLNNDFSPEFIFWRIEKTNLVRVNRYKEWFKNIVKPKLYEVYKTVKKYQEDKELFDNFKEMVYQIKNKQLHEKFENTTCLLLSSEFGSDDETPIETDDEDGFAQSIYFFNED